MCIRDSNNFTTNTVEYFDGMFQLYNELKYLDLSNWDTSNAVSMISMFLECSKLKEIKGIDKFITKNVLL